MGVVDVVERAEGVAAAVAKVVEVDVVENVMNAQTDPHAFRRRLRMVLNQLAPLVVTAREVAVPDASQAVAAPAVLGDVGVKERVLLLTGLVANTNVVTEQDVGATFPIGAWYCLRALVLVSVVGILILM